MPIKNQRVRVGGSGFTVFHWGIDGSQKGQQIIAFADRVAVQSVRPVVDPQVIQPLNAIRPIEIVTPGAHGHGVITLTLTELYNRPVWDRLTGLTGTNDISQIMRTVAAMDKGIKITKFIIPPNAAATNGQSIYSETFHECIVASMNDDEEIAVDTMSLPKVMELWYTYSVRSTYNAALKNILDPSTGFVNNA